PDTLAVLDLSDPDRYLAVAAEIKPSAQHRVGCQTARQRFRPGWRRSCPGSFRFGGHRSRLGDDGPLRPTLQIRRAWPLARRPQYRADDPAVGTAAAQVAF